MNPRPRDRSVYKTPEESRKSPGRMSGKSLDDSAAPLRSVPGDFPGRIGPEENRRIVLVAVTILVGLAGIFCSRGPSRPRPAAETVPVVYSTDLFHPHDDPDDHFDLAVLYSLQELDILGIVLDQGEKQDLRPGRVPVEQMNRLTGRDVPCAPGLAVPLKSPEDAALDQPSKYQAGVGLILDVLENSEAPVTLISVGSLRDIAAAFNRRPDLFRARVGRLMIFIGEAGAETREWNVGLDPSAYIRILNSGLPVWWIPCFDGGNFRNNGHASFWRASQADLLGDCPDRVMNFFIYALLRKTDPEPLAFLEGAVDPTEKDKIFSETRNLWCAAVFTAAAGREIIETEDGWVAPRPDSRPAGGRRIEAFRFVPVTLSVDENAKVSYGDSPGARRIMRFEIVDPASYPEVMTSVTRHLIGDLGR